MLHSPHSVHQAVLSAYFQFNPNPLQDRLVDAAHALQLDIHGFGVWNPALTQHLPTDSKLFVELSDGWVTATVSSTSAKSAQISTPHGNFTLKNSHSCSFQSPMDLPIPTHLMTPEQLLPFIQDLPKPHSSPPIPHGGTLGPSCKLGVHVSLPAFQHRLFSSDLHEWKCSKAYQMLVRAPPQALWVYIDGSEKNSLTGAAAVFCPHNGPTFAITIPSPFRGSGDAEFWALLSCLRFIRLHLSAKHICILSDNSEVVSVFGKAADDQPSQCPTHPKSETHRYNWLVVFKNEVHNIQAVVEVAWIKAHVGFLGNEVADALAKWIYYSCPPHPNSIPPPPKGCISLNGIPLTNKLKKKDLSHVSPMHVHSALHHLSSYDWYRHSSKLDNLPFLWTSVTLWVEGFPSHQDMFSYRCHLCDALPPLDPLSMLSHCTSLWFLQDLFLRAWPSSTWQFVLPWWSSARPGEKRNLIRTLVPASLHTKLKTSMGMTPEQLSAFLVHRRPAITTAVHTCHQWLQDHPPPSLPTVRSGINHFCTPNSIYSTSFLPEHKKRRAPQGYTPPPPIPLKVRKRSQPSSRSQSTRPQSFPQCTAPPPPARPSPTPPSPQSRSRPLPKPSSARPKKRIKKGQG